MISQWREHRSIDLTTTLIAAGTGAASGVLTASGVGIVGQVVGGALISGAGSALTQSQEISLGYRDELNEWKILGDMAVGGMCAAISGPGASSVQAGAGGTKQMVSLGTQTIQRTGNALKNGGVKAFFKEAGKATRYYCSSTSTVTKNLIFSIPTNLSRVVGTIYSSLL